MLTPLMPVLLVSGKYSKSLKLLDFISKIGLTLKPSALVKKMLAKCISPTILYNLHYQIGVGLDW